MMNQKACVLLVEDNPRIQLANKDMLELLGYSADIALNLREARKNLSARIPDIIVLDIMLPDGSGLDFLKELRETEDISDIPVLMLTALGTPDNTVKGLSCGADDYVSKPYNYNVLAARIETLLRRSKRINGKIRKGPLELDILASRALFNGGDLQLKPKEFALLLYMVQNENNPISAELIYETIWKQPFADDSQALRTIISRLRKKLYDTGYIITFLRDGSYCFQREE
jgi:DNA-binding response OmpR family regulator